MDVSREVVQEVSEEEEDEPPSRGGKVKMDPEKKSEGKITFERLKKEALEKRKRDNESKSSAQKIRASRSGK